MRDACCNATSSFAVPDVGRPSLERIQATLKSVYLRRYPSRSEDLSEAGSVWLETVEHGVFGFSAMLVSGMYFCIYFFLRPHDIYQIGSCSNESFTVSGS